MTNQTSSTIELALKIFSDGDLNPYWKRAKLEPLLLRAKFMVGIFNPLIYNQCLTELYSAIELL